MCGQRGLPEFKNEKYVVLAGPSLLSLIVLLFSPWSFSPQGMNLLLLYPGQEPHLPPASTGLPGKSPVLTLEELYYYDNLDALIIFRFLKNFQTYGVKKIFF